MSTGTKNHDSTTPLPSTERIGVRDPEILAALVELVDQLEGIGIPDWAGAEGLDLSQAKTAIAAARNTDTLVVHET